MSESYLTAWKTGWSGTPSFDHSKNLIVPNLPIILSMSSKYSDFCSLVPIGLASKTLPSFVLQIKQKSSSLSFSE